MYAQELVRAKGFKEWQTLLSFFKSESTVVLSIIIRIAMVILPYFGPMGKLKFQFSLSVSTQFDLYQHTSEVHVER